MKKSAAKYNAKFIIYFVQGAVAVSKPEHIEYLPIGTDINNKSMFDLELPFRMLNKILEDSDIKVVDLGPPMRSHPIQPLYFPQYWHWNEEGHKVAAKIIADDLISKELLFRNDRM